MRKTRSFIILAAFCAFLSIFFTFVELFSDIRAMGRQESGPFMPVLSFDGLMGLFRSINLFLFLIVVRAIATIKRHDPKHRGTAAFYLVVSSFISMTAASLSSLILENATVAAVFLLGGIICYLWGIILISMVTWGERALDKTVGVLFLMIFIVVAFITSSFFFLDFSIRIALTFTNRMLLFILMPVLTVWLWRHRKIGNGND